MSDLEQMREDVIRKIEAKVLRKLRHPIRSRQPMDYLEMAGQQFSPVLPV